MRKKQLEPISEKQNANKTWINIKEKLENGDEVDHLFIATAMDRLNNVDKWLMNVNKREYLG